MYITESNCLVNTNELLFNPLLKIKYNQLFFNRYENEENLYQYYFLLIIRKIIYRKINY